MTTNEEMENIKRRKGLLKGLISEQEESDKKAIKPDNRFLRTASGDRLKGKKPSKFRAGLSRGLEAAALGITANVGRVTPGQEFKAGIAKGVVGAGLASAAAKRLAAKKSAAETGLASKKELEATRLESAKEIERVKQRGRLEILSSVTAAKATAVSKGRDKGLTEKQTADLYDASVKAINKAHEFKGTAQNALNFLYIQDFNRRIKASKGTLKSEPGKKLKIDF